MKPVFKAVVLDLDDTLTMQNSLRELVLACGVSPTRFTDFMSAFHSKKVEPSEVGAALLALLTSVHGRVARQTVDKVFQSIKVRPEAWPLMSSLRAAGCTLALISSSFDGYVAGMAARFGIEERYSNVRMEFNANDDVKHLDVTFDAAGLKHRHLHDFCRRHSYSPAEVLVVGDNYNDLQMFACTGNGVLLNRPHNQEFQSAAWQVVDTLDQVALLVTAHSVGDTSREPISRCDLAGADPLPGWRRRRPPA